LYGSDDATIMKTILSFESQEGSSRTITLKAFTTNETTDILKNLSKGIAELVLVKRNYQNFQKTRMLSTAKFKVVSVSSFRNKAFDKKPNVPQ
jgi:hypothetical protein